MHCILIFVERSAFLANYFFLREHLSKLLFSGFFRSNIKTTFLHITEDKKRHLRLNSSQEGPSVLRQKGRRGGGEAWLASLFAVNRPEEEEAIIREQDLV